MVELSGAKLKSKSLLIASHSALNKCLLVNNQTMHLPANENRDGRAQVSINTSIDSLSCSQNTGT